MVQGGVLVVANPSLSHPRQALTGAGAHKPPLVAPAASAPSTAPSAAAAPPLDTACEGGAGMGRDRKGTLGYQQQRRTSHKIPSALPS
jgi:hypothetical protein